MTAAIILILSGVLIGAGLTVFWRDLTRNRRRAFVSERDGWDRVTALEAEADVTISHGPTDELADHAPRQDFRSAAQQFSDQIAASREQGTDGNAVDPPAARPALRDDDTPSSGTIRNHPAEQQWAAISPLLATAVERVNAVLAPLHLAVGAMGEPAWSYKNKGFGGYRRLLLGDESIAWLRLELSADGQLHASVKAHKDDRSGINLSAHAPAADLDAAKASDLLSHCLKPAATFAAAVAPPSQGDERDASADAWNNIDATVISALKATNGALAQAGARLAPLGPVAWDPDARRHRLALAVEVNGEDVARMLIEQQVHEIEVSVGVREASLIELGRRRRMPLAGITIHTLAELIAGCAWPTIARYREARRSA